MPVYQGYITWCDRCSWNLASQEKARPKNLFETLSLKLGNRFGKEQFDLMAQATELKPTLTPTRVAAFLVAGLVHCFTLLLFLLGMATIFLTPFTVFTLFGVIFVVMAWLLCPRIRRLPSENIAGQEQYAALYSLANRISEALGARKVDVIVLDDQFNASFYRAGWQRKDVVMLGLPIFEILAPQERVALLAHEIGHGVNGDPTRSFLIGTALYSLNECYRMIHPARLWDSRGGATAFATFVANFVMLAFSQIPRFWLHVLAL